MQKDLIRIAGDSRLAPHAGLLPSDSTTLGKICSLTDERFHELLDNGTIHPSMGRNDMAVHAAQDSLGRDLAFEGTSGEVIWPEIAPGRACAPPGRGFKRAKPT